MGVTSQRQINNLQLIGTNASSLLSLKFTLHYAFLRLRIIQINTITTINYHSSCNGRTPFKMKIQNQFKNSLAPVAYSNYF